eukprot:410697_1
MTDGKNDQETIRHRPSLIQSQTSATKFTKSGLSNAEDDYDSDSDSDSDDSDLPMTQLFLKLHETNEDITLAQNGYKKVDTICNTLQGEIIKAEVIKSSLTDISIGSYVAIKKTNKKLLKAHTAIQDGITYCVSKNAVKEALILSQLTLKSYDNNNVKHNIIRFIDSFTSENNFYLVMEYIENGITVNEFIQRSHELIHRKKMSFKHYRKIVKNIMWQMVTVFEWLHETAHCCHLDIHSKNLMLTVQFIKQSDGCYKIDDGATVKLCDFGVSELCDLKTANYEKTKKAFELISRKLTIENEYLASPKAYEGEPLGMVFYQCLVGKQLYTPQDMWEIY